MISREDIQKLAALARLPVPETEAEGYARDMEEIVVFVQQVRDIPLGETTEVSAQEGAMRADGEPHESGIYTKALLAGTSEVEGGYVRVKKIL